MFKYLFTKFKDRISSFMDAGLHDEIEAIINRAALERPMVEGSFQLLIAELPEQVHVQLRSRLKTKKSFIDKLLREQNKGRTDYQPSSLTDTLAFRFVCHFQEDVLTMAEALLKHAANGTFDSASDCRIYTTKGHGQQALHVMLEKLFSKFKMPLVIAEKDSRYTSVHMLIMPKFPASKIFEVQIRNVFEDAWCEIEHALKYKGNDSLNPSVSEHLKVLNSLAQTCSEYSEVIANDCQAALPNQNKDKIITVGEDDGELSVFSVKNKKSFVLAAKLGEEGNYSQAISNLKAIQIQDTEPNFVAQRFLVDMEIALNLLRHDQFSEAREKYETIRESEDQRAIVHYRIADCYRQIAKIDAAQAYFDNAFERLGNKSNTRSEVQFLLEKLPFRRAHIAWRMENPDAALKIMLELETAVRKNKIKVDSIKLYNCISYYEIEAAKHENRDIDIDLVGRCLEKLLLNNVLTGGNIHAIDTYAWACLKIGDLQKAREAAKIILSMQQFSEDNQLPTFVSASGIKQRLSSDEYALVNHHIGIIMQQTKHLSNNIPNEV